MIVYAIYNNPLLADSFDFFNDAKDTIDWLRGIYPRGHQIADALERKWKEWQATNGIGSKSNCEELPASRGKFDYTYVHKQPPDPNHKPVDGLTPAEHDIISNLGFLANKISALPTLHPSDVPEAYQHIHALQNMVMARVAVRLHPDVFLVRPTQ